MNRVRLCFGALVHVQDTECCSRACTGLLLPILGALPDSLIIIVSGLGGSLAEAQEQVGPQLLSARRAAVSHGEHCNSWLGRDPASKAPPDALTARHYMRRWQWAWARLRAAPSCCSRSRGEARCGPAAATSGRRCAAADMPRISRAARPPCTMHGSSGTLQRTTGLVLQPHACEPAGPRDRQAADGHEEHHDDGRHHRQIHAPECRHHERDGAVVPGHSGEGGRMLRRCPADRISTAFIHRKKKTKTR